MKKREIKNYGRSVKDRLLTVSIESGIPYMTILVRIIHCSRTISIKTPLELPDGGDS